MSAGLDERAVRSAKARVPFLATLTGQGVGSGVMSPVTVSCHVELLVEQPGAVTLSRMLKVPGLVGMPEMVPVLGSIDKPWGRKFAEKLPPLWFVPGVKENGAPVGIELGF
jgi:hypothetical protein